jgi:N-acetylglucosamine-6-phosphate deacetylase
MKQLSGSLVQPDGILSPGTLTIENDRIVDIRSGVGPSPSSGHLVVPGFIDLHVHGVLGIDTLDPGEAIASMAAHLPRYGVTAFCPTTVACAPGPLGAVLEQVRRAREVPRARSARVLPAHLESNFINAEYRGAQPASCLRSPRAAYERRPGGRARSAARVDIDPDFSACSNRTDDFDAGDILGELERRPSEVGIFTLAPELEGGLDLIEWLAGRGYRVSLGHSAASYDIARAAISAGARHATHLFNRMPPLAHRAPGLVGAILESDEVLAELICDGFHVHPSLLRTAIRSKGPSRVVAITDGTALSGLGAGARARIGGQDITSTDGTARLSDGTLAGSVLTMDRAFKTLIESVGLPIEDAVKLCATTAARELGLTGQGVLAVDALADVAVLDKNLTVVETYIGGELAYSREKAFT